MIFLSAEDIERLTGRKRPKAQCDFLSREGYRFRTNAVGEPLVLEDEVRRKFGLPEKIPSTRGRNDEPDLNWQLMRNRGMVTGRGQTKNA